MDALFVAFANSKRFFLSRQICENQAALSRRRIAMRKHPPSSGFVCKRWSVLFLFFSIFHLRYQYPISFYMRICTEPFADNFPSSARLRQSEFFVERFVIRADCNRHRVSTANRCGRSRLFGM
jgi:hypothetical protein